MSVRIGQVEISIARVAESEPASSAVGYSLVPLPQLISAEATVSQERLELLLNFRCFSLISVLAERLNNLV